MGYIFPENLCNAFLKPKTIPQLNSFIQAQLQVIKKYEFISWKHFSSVSRQKKFKIKKITPFKLSTLTSVCKT